MPDAARCYACLRQRLLIRLTDDAAMITLLSCFADMLRYALPYATPYAVDTLATLHAGYYIQRKDIAAYKI